MFFHAAAMPLRYVLMLRQRLYVYDMSAARYRHCYRPTDAAADVADMRWRRHMIRAILRRVTSVIARCY